MLKQTLLFLMLFTLKTCFSMEAQDQTYQEILEPITPTLDGMPYELQEMIFKEVLKQSVDNLRIPISGKDRLKKPKIDSASWDFECLYSRMIQNLRLINHKYDSLILNLGNYVPYFLYLKLRKLTFRQKFNVLLRFLESSQNSCLLIVSLLSFLDVTQLGPKLFNIKFQLLKDAFKKGIIRSAFIFYPYLSKNFSNACLLKLSHVNKIKPELLDLLILIRSNIPLLDNPLEYFENKLSKRETFSSLEDSCFKYIRYFNQSSEYAKGPLDLFDLDELFNYYIETNSRHSITLVKRLKEINLNNIRLNCMDSLMSAAFCNNLPLVVHHIEKGANKYFMMNGVNCIYWALLGNSKEVLDYLLPDIEIINSNWILYKQCWDWAVINCDASALQYLFTKLHQNLSSYEFNRILSNEALFIEDSNQVYLVNPRFNKLISFFDEPKLLFLINIGISLTRFDSSSSSNSEILNKLFAHNDNTELIDKTLKELKAINGIDIVSAKDVIRACDIAAKKMHKRKTRRARNAQAYQPLQINNESRNSSIKNKSSLLDFAKMIGYPIVIFGLIAYTVYCDKVTLPWENTENKAI